MFTRNWRFYIEDKDGNEKTLFKQKFKFPERSKTWKTMQGWLNKGEQPFENFIIQRIGYELIENKTN